MPLYEYQARDRAGNLATGQVEADNPGAAAAALQGQGLYPTQLRPARGRRGRDGAAPAAVPPVSATPAPPGLSGRAGPARAPAGVSAGALAGAGLGPAAGAGVGAAATEGPIARTGLAGGIGPAGRSGPGVGTWTPAARFAPAGSGGAGLAATALGRVEVPQPQGARQWVPRPGGVPLAPMSPARVEAAAASASPAGARPGGFRMAAGGGAVAAAATAGAATATAGVGAPGLGIPRAAPGGGAAPASRWAKLAKMEITLGPVIRPADLAAFSYQMSSMLEAGVPLLTALRVTMAQTPNRRWQQVLMFVAHQVESGSTLYQALASHPRVFPPLYRGLVESGELGGRLAEAFARISQQIEKEVELRQKLGNAMIYPGAVLTVALGVVTLLLTVVLPSFRSMFASMNIPLPAPTRLLFAVGDFLSKNALWLAGGVATFVLVAVAAWESPRLRLRRDRFLLRAPIVGRVVLLGEIASLTRTLGTLLATGIPLLNAVAMTARVVGNQAVVAALLDAAQQVRQGHDLAGPLRQSRLFPPMVTQMIAVGEESGSLDNVLLRLGEYYEREAANGVARLTALLEPAIILFLGGIVAFLVASVMLPVFSMGSGVLKQ